jgi:four helix bundle protein
MEMAFEIFQMTKVFPVEERFSLTDQVRRSSRSVCANIAEAWRKRRYKAAFIAKLSDAEGEAAETQVWLEVALRCGYVKEQLCSSIGKRYDEILGQLVKMINECDKCLIRVSISDSHFLRFTDSSSKKRS